MAPRSRYTYAESSDDESIPSRSSSSESSSNSFVADGDDEIMHVVDDEELSSDGSEDFDLDISYDTYLEKNSVAKRGAKRSLSGEPVAHCDNRQDDIVSLLSESEDESISDHNIIHPRKKQRVFERVERVEEFPDASSDASSDDSDGVIKVKFDWQPGAKFDMINIIMSRGGVDLEIEKTYSHNRQESPRNRCQFSGAVARYVGRALKEPRSGLNAKESAMLAYVNARRHEYKRAIVREIARKEGSVAFDFTVKI